MSHVPSRSRRRRVPPGLLLALGLLFVLALLLAPPSTRIGRAASPYAIPIVTGVSPAVGAPAGGTTVTITGSNFTGATVVDFGTKAASSFKVDSDTQITATSPKQTASTVDVTVITPSGASPAGAADQFIYAKVPAVTGVTPDSGPAGAATAVTITGTAFKGATKVAFGSAAAQSFTVKSDTKIIATSPDGASGAVDVRVTTPGGTSAVASVDKFTFTSTSTSTTTTTTSRSTATTTTTTTTTTASDTSTAVTHTSTSSRGTSTTVTLPAPISTSTSASTSASTPGTATPTPVPATRPLQAVGAPLVGLVLVRITHRSGVIGELLGLHGIGEAIVGESIALRCRTACARPLTVMLAVRNLARAARQTVRLSHALLLSRATRIEIDVSAAGKLSRFARYAFSTRGSSLLVRLTTSGCMWASGIAVPCAAPAG